MDKIVCVGKNYLDHIQEMGGSKPELPVLFLKPPSILLECPQNGKSIQAKLPRNSGVVHHECEIVLQISKGGFELDAKAAAASIGAVTLGLDLTLRTLQTELKAKGQPWTTSKVFPNSAVIGPWFKTHGSLEALMSSPFEFKVNGELRQKGLGSQMLHSPESCVAYISQHFPLCEGDLIFTGTPAGVGALKPGDVSELAWAHEDQNLVHYFVNWI